MAKKPKAEPDDLGRSVPLVPAMFQSSVYTLPDLDALDEIMNAEAAGFIYARDAHPNARRLAQQLAELEGAETPVNQSVGRRASAFGKCRRRASEGNDDQQRSNSDHQEQPG